MLKSITFGILSLVLTQQAFANYNCTSASGATLTVEHMPQKGTVSPQSLVNVTLNSQAVFAGFYDSVHGYSLKDSQGQAVLLEIKSVPHYGGRCGRCVPEISNEIYAKLTLPESEPLTFSCN